MTYAQPTAQLAAFAAEATYEDLPQTVRDTSRSLLVDSLGCAVAGHLVEKGSMPTALVAAMGGAEQTHVMGTDLRVPIPFACLANGELINALDFDAILAPGHVTPYVVPPALAFAEFTDARGEQLLLGIAVAHEIGCRVAAALDGMRQWGDDGDESPISPASGYGSVIFGAVAGAGSILGFDPFDMANLFGIAGYAAPVPALSKFVTSPHSFHVKYTSAGQLAMNAAVSVLLADRGFHGDPAVLDGDYGFWRMFASRQCNWDFMLGSLGDEWRMLRAEIKPFPSFRMSHDALSALRSLMDQNDIHPEAITRITATADPLCTSDCYLNTELTDHTDAQISWRYVLAAACYYEQPTSWQVEALDDPRVRDLASRVEIVPIADRRTVEQRLNADGTVEKAYPVWLKSTVEIEAAGNTYFAPAPAVTKGHPDNPLSFDEIDGKYLANVSLRLGAEPASESLNRLKTAEQYGTRDLISSLRPDAAVSARR